MKAVKGNGTISIYISSESAKSAKRDDCLSTIPKFLQAELLGSESFAKERRIRYELVLSSHARK